jgi:hypothetical protein
MSELTKTLPGSWYCSKRLQELEMQAVFLKAWYLLGPVTRFQVGNNLTCEIAQVELEVTRDSQSGFHVYQRPENAELPHHLTSTGLLFAALSVGAVSFETFFPGLEILLSKFDFTSLPHRRSIAYEGNFNWKTMVDGYQECLHCQYTHRSFSVLYPPTFYAVHNYGNYSQHIADPEKSTDGLFLYFFPICTLNFYNGGMSSFRVCPTAKPGVTRMEFDYYHEKDGEEFEEYFKFVRKVAMEDYELCETAQANLEQGVYCQGVLNPKKEGGVIHYQQQVKKLVMAAYQRELKCA